MAKGVLSMSRKAFAFGRRTAMVLRVLGGVLVLGLGFDAGKAFALDCGDYAYPVCRGPADQFQGGFKPGTGFGGFGGGACRAARTPVIFIHGNGESAIVWDAPVTDPVKGYDLPRRSVYDEFRARGYRDCELFGVTFLRPDEQKNPRGNYHRPAKYDIVLRFIDEVLAYTGKDRVDIVAHSLGATMTLAALNYGDRKRPGRSPWKKVRRFISIAGALRGLSSCREAGYMNPLVATCAAENTFSKYSFGFYPDTGKRFRGKNRWTGEGPEGLRKIPRHQPHVGFYTISAGLADAVLCPGRSEDKSCADSALFDEAPNVVAQLDCGAPGGRTVFRARPSVSEQEKSGLGHFKARINTGEIVAEMLLTDCRGRACRGAYAGGPVQMKRQQVTDR